MMKLLSRFWSDRSGATAIEYGLIAVLVSITILTASVKIGGGVTAKYDQINSYVAQ